MSGLSLTAPVELVAGVRRFVEEEVEPHAARWDAEERIPATLVESLARHGYLGAALPAEYDGLGLDALAVGQLHRELGRSSASVQGVVNVHNMAAQALLRWGSAVQRAQWLPRLARGECLLSFAITEPDVGSDAKSVATNARRTADGWVLDGVKRWITCGQIADAALVLAQCDGQPTAFLVDLDADGCVRRPIRGMHGCRGYMLAELRFEECRVPDGRLIGRAGFGLSHVMAAGLDAGRYCLAWCCVGMAEACVATCLTHASQRRQFGAPLHDHQLIQRLISDMVTETEAARLLCEQAARLREARDGRAAMATAMAKYFAANAVNQVAASAVQVCGARGVSSEYAVERHLRDGRIMELIEGSTQVHQMLLAAHAVRAAGAWR